MVKHKVIGWHLPHCTWNILNIIIIIIINIKDLLMLFRTRMSHFNISLPYSENNALFVRGSLPHKFGSCPAKSTVCSSGHWAALLEQWDVRGLAQEYYLSGGNEGAASAAFLLSRSRMICSSGNRTSDLHCKGYHSRVGLCEISHVTFKAYLVLKNLPY